MTLPLALPLAPLLAAALAVAAPSAPAAAVSPAAPPAAAGPVPVVPAADPAALVADADPRLAANKRLVVDFWREVIEAGHLERADRYLAPGYVQHNPNVPTGRAGFVAFFSKLVTPHAIAPRIQAPLVALVAEGDLVVLSFASRRPDPADAHRTYTTTWFDMFRVKDGRIVEHWDCAPKE